MPGLDCLPPYIGREDDRRDILTLCSVFALVQTLELLLGSRLHHVLRPFPHHPHLSCAIPSPSSCAILAYRIVISQSRKQVTMTSNKSNDASGGCPFEANKGFATLEGREEYLKVHHEKAAHQEENGQPQEAAENGVETISDSLYADMDTSKPLYFWQLYSIIGKETIMTFVTEFYNRIYADTEEEWFLVAFTGIGDKVHHIKSQSSYWIDAMGGGRVYFGGKSRVNFHHYSNHAEHIMNERGAKRWMHHMRGAIQSYDFSKFNDPRIVPALVEFLRIKVMTYAEEHQWEFDDSDFTVSDFDFQQKDKVAKSAGAVSTTEEEEGEQ